MEDKILDKIRKLFALAGNNSNENEADSAMRMAKKLLDKHNLSVYDLKEKDDVGIKIEDNVNMPWTRTIYNAIAKLYDVDYLRNKTDGITKHLLIGTESNRVTASIVIDFVINEIRDSSISMGNGYRNAMAEGVYSQVYLILEERNKSKDEVIPGTGLLPVDASKIAYENNKEWIDEFMGKVAIRKQTQNAYNSSGFSAGSKINLGAHLSNKKALN